jgi:hypothetical protein
MTAHAPTSRATAPSRVVYDGRELLGSVCQHGNEFVALNRLGTRIGIYDSAGEAVEAIAAAAARVVR